MRTLRKSAIALPLLLLLSAGDGHASEQDFDWELRAAEITKRSSYSSQTRARSKNKPECRPSYPDICIPTTTTELDCQDLAFGMFVNAGSDPHKLDRDQDGAACEQNARNIGDIEKGAPFCIVVGPRKNETRVVAQWGDRYVVADIPASDDTHLVNARVPTSGKEILRVSQRGRRQPSLRRRRCTSADAQNSVLVNVSWKKRPLIAEYLWGEPLETIAATQVEQSFKVKKIVKAEELAAATTPVIAQEAGSFVTFDDGRAYDLTGLWGAGFSKPVMANISLTR